MARFLSNVVAVVGLVTLGAGCAGVDVNFETPHDHVTFIINGETGQWGTQYKVARDIVRFPVRFEAIASGTPEQFTTRIVPDTGREGKLLFEWDGRRYVVPFRVKASRMQ